jgi:hypothetical protein
MNPVHLHSLHYRIPANVFLLVLTSLGFGLVEIGLNIWKRKDKDDSIGGWQK